MGIFARPFKKVNALTAMRGTTRGSCAYVKVHKTVTWDVGMTDDTAHESRAEECLRLATQPQNDPGSRIALLTMAQRFMEWATNRGKNLRGDALLPDTDAEPDRPVRHGGFARGVRRDRAIAGLNLRGETQPFPAKQ
jgi:hypothetical protein